MKNTFILSLGVIVLCIAAFMVFWRITAISRNSGPVKDLVLAQFLYNPIQIPGSIVASQNQFEMLDGGHYKVTGMSSVTNKMTTFVTAEMLVEPISYASGDLNGDKFGDFVVIVTSNTGGNGQFFNLVAYTNSSGKPLLADSVFLGDRIKINSVKIEDQVIYVDIITQGPGEPMCCGTLQKIEKFKLSGNKLIKLEQ